ncbi:hypothetical protein C447_01290 [Halococcus hamelinensis 100A6]|uniref:Uncharacterized protein n=1 Tax=Halococcus hamelinensis 100A6 TaxID=1132509 RepID=M0M6V5_9EURY|nr:hypothetical protein C447_01290 [Halococcus hamelinensis 100A6]
MIQPLFEESRVIPALHFIVVHQLLSVITLAQKHASTIFSDKPKFVKHLIQSILNSIPILPTGRIF